MRARRPEDPTTTGTDEVRHRIVAACHALAERGLVHGSAGNVSVRIGDRVALTGTGVRFAEITPDQVTVVDPAGAVVAGALAPTSEIGIHLGIYRRYDTAAVVHTHAPLATAVGLIADELPCIHYQLLSLGGAVPVVPYATFGTAELAESVLDALAGRSAALLANHGAVTHGPSLEQAVEATVLLEWACDVYLRARSVGTPRALDAAAREAVVRQAVALSYGATRPQPDRPTPTTRSTR